MYQIFFTGKNSYIYCSKPYRDSCKTDDECSSMDCSKEGVCMMQAQGPSDIKYYGSAIVLMMGFFLLAGACIFDVFIIFLSIHKNGNAQILVEFIV
ncbi:hypothetical protein H8356DRAFT_1739609 [Neocallimastix lanati (nom. inval.)]|nr:hypothetical protein H8356DRAFT_1739609 [Neocallimastix sp. JGI-2020a]